MRIYPKPFLVLLILALALPFLAVVNAQGSSFDTAEDITSTGSKTCVYIDDGDHYYRYYLQLGDGASILVCLNPSSSLDVDLYVYDSNRNFLEDSVHGSGREDCVELQGPYDGYIYIKVHHYYGSGYYNLKIGDHAPDPDETCGTSSSPTPSWPSSGSDSSTGCPCEVPFPCHCNVFGWDPCYSLAQVYCAFTGFGNAIQQFFNSVTRIFQSITNAITGFFTSLAQSIMNGINAVASFFRRLGQSIVNGVNAIVGFFQNLAQSIVNFFVGVGQAILSGAQAIGSGIASFFTAVFQGIVSFFQALWRGISSLFQGLGSALGGAGDWLGQNWLLLIGIVLIVFGIFTNGALTIVGAIILMAYALSTGQLNWGMLLVAIGCIVLGFALRR